MIFHNFATSKTALTVPDKELLFENYFDGMYLDGETPQEKCR